jgi:hypothetical protein
MINDGSHPHPYPPKYMPNESNVNIKAPGNKKHTCNIHSGMQETTVSLTVRQPITTNVLRVETPIEIVACAGTTTFAAHLKKA